MKPETRMQRLLLLLGFMLSFAALADINIPLGQQGNAAITLPANGTTKNTVLEQYGLPDVEHPPVGTPAIRRWDYRDFSVYFENDRVINSVRDHQPQYPQAQP